MTDNLKEVFISQMIKKHTNKFMNRFELDLTNEANVEKTIIEVVSETFDFLETGGHK